MNINLDLPTLLATIADAVIVSDAHEKIIVWNAGATRIFGYSEAEALGKTVDLIVPERQRHRHNEGYSLSMATGTTKYGNTTLRVPAQHKDGHILSIAFTVGMLFDDHHQACGVVAVLRDETERFAQERALKQRIADLEKTSS
jgi:PAS domain S-box-containing protein